MQILLFLFDLLVVGFFVSSLWCRGVAVFVEVVLRCGGHVRLGVRLGDLSGFEFCLRRVLL